MLSDPVANLITYSHFAEITNGIAVIGGRTAGAFDPFLPGWQVMLSCQALLQARPRGNVRVQRDFPADGHDEGANEGNEPVPDKSCIAVLEELAVAGNNYYIVKERRMEYYRENFNQCVKHILQRIPPRIISRFVRRQSP